MSGFLISRPSFVTVLACAAVVSFIFSPHAAKAYPTVAPVESGANPILRSFKQSSLLSPEPGIFSGSTSESQSWRDHERNATSVIFHQPSLLLRNGHLGYNLNTPDNRPHQEELSQVQRGQSLGGVKPASSIFPSLPDRQPSVNHSPFVHSKNSEPPGFVAPNNGNSQSGYHFNWHPLIIRKSSTVQQERPLPQSVSQSHDQFPKSGSSAVYESRSEHKTAWQSPISFMTSGYWRSHPDSKGHGRGNMNGFAEAGQRSSTSIWSQSSKFPSFSRPNIPFQPSVGSSGLDTSFFKPRPSPEKLTSSLTHYSQGVSAATSKNDKSSYMKVQSYLLGDSHSSDKPKGVIAEPATHGFQNKIYRGRDFNQQTETNLARKRPDLFNANSVANGTHFNGRNVVKYQPASVIYRAISRKDTPQKFEEASAKDAKSSQVQAVQKGPIQQSSNPSKGHSHWSNLKKNSQQPINSNKEANSEPRDYRFMRPSLLQKYSFGQRIASRNLAQERTGYSSISRDLLDATSPATTKSLSYQEVPLMLHRINATDRNIGGIYRAYKRLQGQTQPTASNFNQEGNDNARSSGLSSALSTNRQKDLKMHSKPHVKSDIFKLVTLTRVKPTLLGKDSEIHKLTTPQSKIDQHKLTISSFSGGKDTQNSSGQRNIAIAQQPKFKAVTYHDILGSASFSSVKPARTTTYREHLQKLTTIKIPKEMVSQTVHLKDMVQSINESYKNGTEINIADKLDFRKAEAETPLSDVTESEAKIVPHGLPSEENLSENLSELDYLRTSTGNVSFQSLNLNL